jgi:preprotein translocase subunit SecD
MKFCPKCKEVKPPTEWPASKKLNYCSECKREYDREYWQKTKALRNERKRANATQVRNRNRAYVWDFLTKNPCIDCGESDPIVLEFDHIQDKEENVSILVGNAASIERLDEEIRKCEVRCANCHRRKTASQFNWYCGP